MTDSPKIIAENGRRSAAIFSMTILFCTIVYLRVYCLLFY